MSNRRAFLDTCPGERRGVITLGGRPERLIIERDGEGARARLGALHAARIRRIDKASATAFLDLGDGLEAIAAMAGQAPTEGAAVAVEITAEARGDKAAVARILGPADGEPRLNGAPPTLIERLREWGQGAAIVEGAAARDAADLAEDQALATVHPLAGGGSIAVEPTRALIAVDVDLGAGVGGRAARAANLAAIAEAARLIRLKSLGGLVVIDLVGKGQDGEAMAAAAKRAFAPDQPGVNLGPVNRFGTLTLALPWRLTPVSESLVGADGVLTPRSLAQRLVRALEREGRADPGGQPQAVCAPQVAAQLTPLVAELGPRFSVTAQPDLPADQGYVRIP